MSPYRAALLKDLTVQWRTRVHIVAILLFGITALLLFSFAVGPNTAALRQHAAGFLWLSLMLASTLTLAESFQSEMAHRALEGSLLMPVPAAALYYAKAAANALQLTLLGIGLIPVMVVLYDAGTARILGVIGVIAAGAAALSAPGTLYAAMTERARAKQTLLPLLLFPLLVPVLLAAVKATSLLILGDPMGQLSSWVSLLLVFDLLHWTLGGLLFERVIED
jgi:heme exporter protein B